MPQQPKRRECDDEQYPGDRPRDHLQPLNGPHQAVFVEEFLQFGGERFGFFAGAVDQGDLCAWGMLD